MSTYQFIPLPADTCEELYSGLSECHDTLELLIDYAMGSCPPTAKNAGLYSTMSLLRQRISALSETVDPSSIAKLARHAERQKPPCHNSLAQQHSYPFQEVLAHCKTADIPLAQAQDCLSLLCEMVELAEGKHKTLYSLSGIMHMLNHITFQVEESRELLKRLHDKGEYHAN